MKLSNQYRLLKRARITLAPEYSWVGPNRRIALVKMFYDEAMENFKRRDFPFHNLFGEKATRIVIPYENKVKRQIEEAVKKTAGYDRVDWETGEAVKIIPPHPDAPPPTPGAPPKERRVGLGKVIGRLPNGEAWLDWWANNQEFVKNSNYSIVISRHPVDVIRMSDHRNIESCHSPGEEEWGSCLNETKHGGLVTYLVKSGDLEDFSPEQIAGQQEIFADDERRIPGIEPVSRLRVRRYTHRVTSEDDRQFDLAVPEIKLYGKQNWAFRNVVKDWAWEAQEDLIRGERLRIRDFIRRGGRYADTNDGGLFNEFFGDDLDTGNAKFGTRGEEAESDDELFEKKREEMEGTRAYWERHFKHCSTAYEELEEPEGVFTWSGEVEVDINSNMINEDKIKDIEASLTRGNNPLNLYLSNNGFETGALEDDIQLYTGTPTSIIISVADVVTPRGGPPGYGQYCSLLQRKFENKYEQLRRVILSWLMENQFVNPTPVREFGKSGVQFSNFVVDINEGEMEAAAEAPIGKHDQKLWSGYEFKAAINDEVRKIVTQDLERIIRAKQQSQGIQSEEPFQVGHHYNLTNFKTELRTNIRLGPNPDVLLRITFRADDLTSRADFQGVIDLLTVVDKLFPRIVEDCMVVLDRLYDQRTKHLKELQGQGYYGGGPD